MAVVNQLINSPIGPLRDASGTALTGLTFGNKTAFLASTPATTAMLTITEVGSGFYVATFTPSAVGTWLAAATYPANGTTRDITGTYEVVTAAQADPAAALSGSTITVDSAVDTDGTLTLRQGDDFTNALGNPIRFTDTESAWSDLTSATVCLILTDLAGTTVLSQPGTVVTATGSDKAVRFDLTSTQTGALTRGKYQYKYRVSAALSPSGSETLARGGVVVNRGGGS